MSRSALAICFLTAMLPLVEPPVRAASLPENSDTSRVTILANVDSAIVIIDSARAGVTPLLVDSITPGMHRITLLHPDIANWQTGSVRDTFSVQRGEIRVLKYTIPVFSDTSGARSPVFRPQNMGSDPVFLNSAVFNSGTSRLYIAGGATVLTGIAAAYFKIKADNRYDEFVNTNNVLLQNESKSLDTTAALFLAATQIGLAFFIYYLLSE